MHDCVVVGAGPAGLSAALYMGRYRRDVLVIHDNSGRAGRIPLTHNVPGFPDGIKGTDLLDKMTRHAVEYGAVISEGKVTAIAQIDNGFSLSLEEGEPIEARSVILATGILLNQVGLPHDVHEQAIEDDVLRYCAVCDAYEHIDKHIGVVGCEESGAGQALFVSRYSEHVTLVPDDYETMPQSDKDKLSANGVSIVKHAMRHVEPTSKTMQLWTEIDGDAMTFDVIYPCFGTRPRTALAEAVGISIREDGCLSPDAHFETKVPGFWAAGDIVKGLDQISVAMGHGAIAATQAHSWLREQDGEI